MKTAKEILEAIEKLDNAERIKLLRALYYKHYDSRPTKEQLEKEKWGDEEW